MHQKSNNAAPRTPASTYRDFNSPRGEIVTSDGIVVANSKETKGGAPFQRDIGRRISTRTSRAIDSFRLVHRRRTRLQRRTHWPYDVAATPRTVGHLRRHRSERGGCHPHGPLKVSSRPPGMRSVIWRWNSRCRRGPDRCDSRECTQSPVRPQRDLVECRIKRA